MLTLNRNRFEAGLSTCFATMLILLPIGLQADVLSVNCGDDGSGLQAAIDGLSSPVGPHTINVTGTCVENISIEKRART